MNALILYDGTRYFADPPPPKETKVYCTVGKKGTWEYTYTHEYPPPPVTLTVEQTTLVGEWGDVRDAMNSAAAQRCYALADEYLMQLKAIEKQLGFRPDAE